MPRISAAQRRRRGAAADPAKKFASNEISYGKSRESIVEYKTMTVLKPHPRHKGL